MREREFLQRIRAIRFARPDGMRAPHKPLLLLLALTRVQEGQCRLGQYERDVRDRLSQLLRDFGPARAKVNPQFPFWHLQNDGLWEIPEDDLARIRGGLGSKGWSASPSDVALVEQGIRGGFPESAHRLLANRPDLVQRAAQAILNAHFPTTLHTAIRDAVGVSLASATGLPHPPEVDPTFRRAVLTAYDNRCAVCDFDLRIDNTPLALDAAHIRWHAAGGPDETSNGLALCTLHHHTFDRGAIGLERSSDNEFCVVVSITVHGQRESSRSLRELRRLHRRTLRLPWQSDQAPHVAHVDWHRHQVFRDGAANTR